MFRPFAVFAALAAVLMLITSHAHATFVRPLWCFTNPSATCSITSSESGQVDLVLVQFPRPNKQQYKNWRSACIVPAFRSTVTAVLNHAGSGNGDYLDIYGSKRNQALDHVDELLDDAEEDSCNFIVIADMECADTDCLARQQSGAEPWSAKLAFASSIVARSTRPLFLMNVSNVESLVSTTTGIIVSECATHNCTSAVAYKAADKRVIRLERTACASLAPLPSNVETSNIIAISGSNDWLECNATNIGVPVSPPTMQQPPSQPTPNPEPPTPTSPETTQQPETATQPAQGPATPPAPSQAPTAEPTPPNTPGASEPAGETELPTEEPVTLQRPTPEASAPGHPTPTPETTWTSHSPGALPEPTSTAHPSSEAHPTDVPRTAHPETEASASSLPTTKGTPSSDEPLTALSTNAQATIAPSPTETKVVTTPAAVITHVPATDAEVPSSTPASSNLLPPTTPATTPVTPSTETDDGTAEDSTSTDSPTTMSPPTTSTATSIPVITVVPATTAAVGPRVESRVSLRISGQSWAEALAANGDDIESAVQVDLAAIFEVPKDAVRIVSLRVGSLIVEATVVHPRQQQSADELFSTASLDNTKASYSAVASDPITLLTASVNPLQPPARGDPSWIEDCRIECILVFSACGFVFVVVSVGAVVVVLTRSSHDDPCVKDANLPPAAAFSDSLDPSMFTVRRKRRVDAVETLSTSDTSAGSEEVPAPSDEAKQTPTAKSKRVQFALYENVEIAGRSRDREWPMNNFHQPNRKAKNNSAAASGDSARGASLFSVLSHRVADVPPQSNPLQHSEVNPLALENFEVETTPPAIAR
jgi:hypothetical protein